MKIDTLGDGSYASALITVTADIAAAVERAYAKLLAADDDSCRTCGGSLDDGEGYDGLCGNCADAMEIEATLKEIEASGHTTPPTQQRPRVLVTVQGGAATVYADPDDVDVLTVDFDTDGVPEDMLAVIGDDGRAIIDTETMAFDEELWRQVEDARDLEDAPDSCPKAQGEGGKHSHPGGYEVCAPGTNPQPDEDVRGQRCAYCLAYIESEDDHESDCERPTEDDDEARTTEDIFETDDAASLCQEAGVKADEPITKFTAEDFAACVIEEMESGSMTREEAIDVLRNANLSKLEDVLLAGSGWVDLWRTWAEMDAEYRRQVAT